MLIAGVLSTALMVTPFAAVAAGAGSGAGGSGSGAGAGVSAQSSAGQGTQDQTRDRIQDPTTHTGDEPLQTRDQDQTRLYTSTTSTSTGTGPMNQEQGGGPMNQEQTQYRLMIEPEHLQVRAQSGTELTQMIQVREQQLEQEAASTTLVERPAIQNANQVRLAVHALLAAQDLLGPSIGGQVAQLAAQVDASAQVTANAQVQAQARGFWTMLFFGGDARAAATIEQEVNQNQARIEQMTRLLSQASSTPGVQATLQAQLTAMQQEQERLQQFAQSEKNRLGIFSWRF